MNYLKHQLLNHEELKILKKNIEKQNLQWEDGKKTAGNHAAKVKNNLQLNKGTDTSQKFAKFIEKKMLSDNLIKSFVLPKLSLIHI